MADTHDSDPRQRSFRPKARITAWVACGLVSLTSVFVAAYFAGQNHVLRQSQASNPLGLTVPQFDATAAVSSEKFSMATGFLSDRAEGLFVLDHNSGLLQCSVMYPRLGQFLGLFTINVHDALGTGKGAQYMMTTGLVDLPTSSKTPFGSSVVYVLNTTTGAYACYAVPFNRVMMNANQQQQAPLQLIATGSADPIVNRDSIR